MRTKAILIGHGRWGRKIERTLKELGVVPDIVTGEAPEDWEVDDLATYTHAIVASPPESHVRWFHTILDCGVPNIFMEKPFALNIHDFNNAYRCYLALNNRPRVTVDYIWTFHDAVRSGMFDANTLFMSITGPKRYSNTPELYEWGSHGVALVSILAHDQLRDAEVSAESDHRLRLLSRYRTGASITFGTGLTWPRNMCVVNGVDLYNVTSKPPLTTALKEFLNEELKLDYMDLTWTVQRILSEVELDWQRRSS